MCECGRFQDGDNGPARSKDVRVRCPGRNGDMMEFGSLIRIDLIVLACERNWSVYRRTRIVNMLGLHA